jgi:hypothetical protein
VDTDTTWTQRYVPLKVTYSKGVAPLWLSSMKYQGISPLTP